MKGIQLYPIGCDCNRMSCDYNACPDDDAYGNAWITSYDCTHGDVCGSAVQECKC